MFDGNVVEIRQVGCSEGAFLDNGRGRANIAGATPLTLTSFYFSSLSVFFLLGCICLMPVGLMIDFHYVSNVAQ